MAKESPGFRKIVVIGGSAGALEVVLALLQNLRAPFAHPLVIVLHRAVSDDGGLAALLSTKTALPVHEVEDKNALQAGHVFLAPPDYHLLFESDGALSLDDSEKVAHSRPSIDVSYSSAATAHGASVVGILLSGANADGVAGLADIQACGGQTVVQAPESAQMPVMPEAAVREGVAERVEDVAGILRFINGL